MDADSALDAFRAVCPHVPPDVARNLLSACNFNVERAIEMHFSSNLGEAAAADEESVPAKMPTIRGVLSHVPQHDLLRKRPRQRVRALSSQQQERELSKGLSFVADFSTRGNGSANSDSTDNSMNRKRKRLADLFRPPFEIMCTLSFDQAQEQCLKVNSNSADPRWLLVNVIDPSVFECQTMNRDVWSSEAVRDVVQANFMFCQWGVSSEEGLRMKTYYPSVVAALPSLCVIDPRTGELVKEWHGVMLGHSDMVMEELLLFMAEHGVPSFDVAPTGVLPLREQQQQQQRAPSTTSNGQSTPPPQTHQKELIDMTEDEQLAYALAQSAASSTAEEQSETNAVPAASSDGAAASEEGQAWGRPAGSGVLDAASETEAEKLALPTSCLSLIPSSSLVVFEGSTTIRFRDPYRKGMSAGELPMLEASFAQETTMQTVFRYLCARRHEDNPQWTDDEVINVALVSDYPKRVFKPTVDALEEDDAASDDNKTIADLGLGNRFQLIVRARTDV